MADFTSSSLNALSSPSDDAFEDDACCICLDPFTSHDPPSITSCKHEYHLQCILDWSQRSNECPICCQLLVLRDPVGQELLAAIASEKLLKSRSLSSVASTSLRFHENFDVDHDSSHSDDSDFDDLIMQHLAAAASRARYVHRRERQRHFGLGPSQGASACPEEVPVLICPLSPRFQDATLSSPNSDSPSPGSPLSSGGRTGISKVTPRVLLTETSSGSQQKTNQSEGLSFPDSIKSKWSATSAKYKESIWRSTQGIKEKLLARNSSVKELSRGVKREVSAGIAGVARMIDRLDLSSKRNAASVSFFSCSGGTSNSMKGKNVVMQESGVTDGSEKNDRICTGSPSHVSPTVPGTVDDSLAQRGN
ncbi:E3 ubiquitin-protein ligase RHF1A isoform X1 [Cucurbita pepo subsp. pepo]|uniref:E3 ubiquitin-protein ligase RHF1A isoform X1 n=1 Tax=Cucurbita pepo subsp. pepo TaxID=3664 RepID=UPI000C9D7904|nr:E3 ubiquitin-protein ligase RHF1A isoform X1 [Cucurbita pepo subsp. pepo]